MFNTIPYNPFPASTDKLAEDAAGIKPVDYSTTEQKTGQKWIDGKDIYVKTFNISAQSANISTSLLSDLNIDKILDLYLMVYAGNEFYKSYTVHYNTDTTLLTSIESGKWIDHLYVKYTKTA